MIAQAILVLAIIACSKTIRYMNPWTSHSPRMRLFRGMAYGGVSGILSAHSLLVAKSAVELLVRTIVDRHNEFNRWQSWVILLSLLGLALSQLYYLHRGLKLCSTSILYPFVFCVYNIIAILDGLIYFDQSSRLSLLHALLVKSQLSEHWKQHRLIYIIDRFWYRDPADWCPCPLLALERRSRHSPASRSDLPYTRHGICRRRRRSLRH